MFVTQNAVCNCETKSTLTYLDQIIQLTWPDHIIRQFGMSCVRTGTLGWVKPILPIGIWDTNRICKHATLYCGFMKFYAPLLQLITAQW